MLKETLPFWVDDGEGNSGYWFKFIIEKDEHDEIRFYIAKFNHETHQWKQTLLTDNQHWSGYSKDAKPQYYFYDHTQKRLINAFQQKMYEQDWAVYQYYDFDIDKFIKISPREEQTYITQEVVFNTTAPVVGVRNYAEFQEPQIFEEPEVIEESIPQNTTEEQLEFLIVYSHEIPKTDGCCMPDMEQRLQIWEIIKNDWLQLKREAKTQAEYAAALKHVINGGQVDFSVTYDDGLTSNITGLRFHFILGSFKNLNDETKLRTLTHADVISFLRQCALKELAENSPSSGSVFELPALTAIQYTQLIDMPKVQEPAFQPVQYNNEDQDFYNGLPSDLLPPQEALFNVYKLLRDTKENLLALSQNQDLEDAQIEALAFYLDSDEAALQEFLLTANDNNLLKMGHWCEIQNQHLGRAIKEMQETIALQANSHVTPTSYSRSISPPSVTNSTITRRPVPEEVAAEDHIPSADLTSKPAFFQQKPVLIGTCSGIMAGLAIDGALLTALFFTTAFVVTMPYVAAAVCAGILIGSLVIGMGIGAGCAAYQDSRNKLHVM